MINLQQLRVLLAVREHGSLTQAAEALRYGVPTVAHHLRTLEAHLEAQLVVRTRGGTELTPLGEFYAAEVAPVLVRLDRAEHAVAGHRDSGVVTLRVGTFASVGSRLMPAAISELEQRHSVRVEVVEGEPTEVVRMLRQGEVHAGVIYDISEEPLFDTPDLEQRTLFAEPYQVMVGRHSEWAEHSKLTREDLTRMRWICSRNDSEASDRVLRRVHSEMGEQIRVLMETDDWYMIHGLVAEGLGCALTTAAPVDQEFEVELRDTVDGLGERRVSFVTTKGARPAAVGWLGEILQRVASSRIAAVTT
ncbi:DNA-binding transcriptional LysR family regulator [Leucobacter exalbidus]|uniref:DNA-binding transcriptional LysR family regulator n=1 Tax=Leucobacter exalbidus TaxID=662960 RepID=A0A940T3D5_9MICO|nr:LysR family transcriptional regulator [Leucobacter exalbidus]MBP1325619.1 DNA-binding transcriptional LysR family regulator [Leucobacter exalbidus]